MEEFRFPNTPPFLHMNSSNLELLNNMASVEGFSNHHQQTTIPTSYDVDQTLGSFGPNVPPFGPSTSHFFHSGHGYIDMNMVNCDPSHSEVGFLASHKLDKAQSNGGKKRKRVNERESQKPKEVVHVRAKRGQATDSHSLAERVRREKINEKLRCLQGLVPGCYKTMGMAVMLEVIINYVRSLQNQIDFLSMKLSAASLYYDFNSSEAEAVEALQGTNGNEAGYGGAWPF